MRCLILAAGHQARWRENGGGGYKQLIEIDGEPVIHRAFRLVSARCPDVITLVDKPSLRIWDGLNPREPAHEPWMGEMGKFLDGKPYWPKSGEVVILYGDVFYTEECLDLILGHKTDQPTIYGRTANARRLESFAIGFDVNRDVDEVEIVARACADANLNKRGGPWRWFFHRHTGEVSYDAQRVKKLATPENGWIETPDDETDDFDTPAQLKAWRKRFRPIQTRRIMPKQIATRRIYGLDRHGREVLVAAPGQPVPDGFREPAPAQDHAQRGPEVSQSGRAKSELSSLTVPQLRELAKRKGVDTDGLRKAEIIAALDG